ncbi:amino acid adenylation domain-containing protein [Pseudomonas sp. GD04042]|nr:amino acid adenylation domain-containing protein [Pseudomonas sp. GD04042]MDG9931285.1 amino acid adenylation domain-containing protein [Pseudomonas sp. GD04042]
MQQRHVATIHTRLDSGYTRKLLQQAPAAYRTQVNDLLLTALARVIARWTGEDSVRVQLEGHGREDLFDEIDLTRTLGWFTSLYPVRLSPADTLEGSLKRIKEQLRGIPAKGVGFGALRYLGEPATRLRLAALPPARITFNYLGQFDGSFVGDGEGAFFVPAEERAGANLSADAPLGNWLSINGQVFASELSMGWSFSREMFREATIQHLADAYAEELRQLIDHCVQGQASAVTPSDFPLAGLTQEQLDCLPLPAREIDDLYPLSPMQQGMLFHTLLEQESGSYINQLRVDVQGLDVERFRHAWDVVVERQEVLRASFVTLFEQPLQVIRKRLELPFTVLDWSQHAQLQQDLDAWALADRQRGFDLLRDPLLRLGVIRTGENSHHLIYTSHHILMDGWSNSQLLGEVLQVYGREACIPYAGRYRDYIEWLAAQDSQVSEAFWRGQLQPLEEPTFLVQALKRDETVDDAGHDDHYQVVDAQRTQALGEFARQQRLTVNTLVQSAWLLLLQRYTGQDCVAFGATVAGRPADLPGVERQLGLFINTLPVIASPRPELTVGQWLEQVQGQNLALREHEHTPLFEIQRWAGRSGDGLFDSILVFENYPVSEVLQQGAPAGLRFSATENHERTNYPLTLTLGLADELTIHYSYDRRYFSAASIGAIAGHFGNLLEGLIADAERPLAELSMLAEGERQRVLGPWSRTADSHPAALCVHQLIEAQVARTPDATALVCGSQSLGYAELNRRANQLAHALRARGVGPDVLVGIAVERSLEMVVGLLGILKAGGAYVPLDPEYPRERLSYMLADSGIGLLLTQAHLREQLGVPEGGQCLLLEAGEDWLEGHAESNPVSINGPQNLAYVIYTSGSTGQPKGAAVRRGSFGNLLRWYREGCGLTPRDGVLLISSHGFDLTQKNIYGVLCVGGQLHLPAPGYDPLGHRQQIEDHRLTVVNCAPSAFYPMLQGEHSKLRSLRHLLLGGEPIQPGELAGWLSASHAAEVVVQNTYGPTECTDVVIGHALPGPAIVGRAGLPIGRPLPGVTVRLLGTAGELVAPGVVGELFIGGDCVGEGYWRRPGLTAERFLPDPFDDGEQGGGRLYRSGDLARFGDDGLIEYLGRVDHQVKIRGLRIELGEIEVKLRALPAIREAVVLAVDGPGGQQLAAYLVAESSPADAQALRGRLRDALRAELPDYMVPSHFLFLDRLPLNPNGKLDRKALPQPDASLHQQAYVAPRTELEERLVAIWAEVLKVERVGLSDNFFELGGHSLLAAQAISQINAQLGIDVPLRLIFENPMLSEFAMALESDGLSLSEDGLSDIEKLMDALAEA